MAETLAPRHLRFSPGWTLIVVVGRRAAREIGLDLLLVPLGLAYVSVIVLTAILWISTKRTPWCGIIALALSILFLPLVSEALLK